MLGRMRDLVYQIKKLCRNSGEGSHETRYKRSRVLLLTARQLTGELGYIHMKVTSLKPKHIDALVAHWRSQNLAVGTMKTRMSHLRWWAKQIKKENVIARENSYYGIEDRIFVVKYSKGLDLCDKKVNEINDDYVKASVLVARAFGLRKEEAIKIIPTLADQSHRLFLKASWCKGGRERTVPILTEQQRYALDNAKSVAGSGSLIPSNLTYYQQRRHYEYLTNKIGLSKLHGLRHHYAQMRYRTLTGWDCPVLGGPQRHNLSTPQRKIDDETRLQISSELGHNRISIVANYIG